MKRNYIEGSLLGSMIGDAFGSFWEFRYRLPTVEDIEEAATFPYGLLKNIGGGQVTDDSEMQLKLSKSLSQQPNPFPIIKIAKNYVDWMCSNPFDIGAATNSALLRVSKLNLDKISEDELMEICKENNPSSLANGCLMRCNPIGIWYHNESNDNIFKFSVMDSKLTHGNEICGIICGIYNICIAELIRNPHNKDNAIKTCEEYLNRINHKEIIGWFKESLIKMDEENNVKLEIDATQQIGFLRHAFQLTFYCLYNELEYEKAMKLVLSYGGDTDTNCCIVGGVIGCYNGRDNIPNSWIYKVLNSPTASNYYKRPEDYHPSKIFEYLKNCPMD